MYTVATIGFETISVSVHECTGVAVLYVAVLNGTLGRDVTVRVSTADLSATGEPYCHLLLLLAWWCDVIASYYTYVYM